MDLNLITGGLIIALMIYMSASRIKMFVDHRNAYTDINQRGDFKKIFTGRLNLIAYIVVLLVSISGFFVVYFNKDTNSSYISWLLVFFVIFTTSSTDILRTIVLHTTYYNDVGIFHNTDYFRYNSIKNFKVTRLAVTVEVHLFNGKVYNIPTKALQHLEDRIVVSKNNKNWEISVFL